MGIKRGGGLFVTTHFLLTLGFSLSTFLGLFAQFFICLAIFFVGLGAFAWDEFEHFYPLAMLGGASWCLGKERGV